MVQNTEGDASAVGEGGGKCIWPRLVFVLADLIFVLADTLIFFVGGGGGVPQKVFKKIHCTFIFGNIYVRVYYRFSYKIEITKIEK